MQLARRDPADVEQVLDQAAPGRARCARSSPPPWRRRSAAASRRPSRWVQPRMALSGVRSSCDSVARNSSFMRLARSASTRAALGREQRLALDLELLLAADVERDAVEAGRLARRLAVDAPLGADPALPAVIGDRPVLDVVDAAPADRGVDRRAHALAIVVVDERIEAIEVDLGIGRQPEVLLALRVPFDRAQRPRAVERAELAGLDRDLERLVGAARLGVGDPLGDARLLLLDEVAASLVLALPAAQRRARRADQGVGVERPLEQDDVAEPGERAARRARPTADAARDQHDEREVRPGRLVRDPVGQGLERRPAERLLGDEGDARAPLQRFVEQLERVADLRHASPARAAPARRPAHRDLAARGRAPVARPQVRSATFIRCCRPSSW